MFHCRVLSAAPPPAPAPPLPSPAPAPAPAAPAAPAPAPAYPTLACLVEQIFFELIPRHLMAREDLSTGGLK